jgi:hypothetical protein
MMPPQLQESGWNGSIPIGMYLLQVGGDALMDGGTIRGTAFIQVCPDRALVN